MATYFISDLHLSPESVDLNLQFEKFLTLSKEDAHALYILGDFFNFWIADEDPSPFARHIKSCLKAYVQSGVACYFIQGNRDFLIGSKFCKETGITLLEETCKIDLYGQSVLLMHGDTLCLDDINYLRFRKAVHQPWLQLIYKFIPFSLKKKLTKRIQGATDDNKATKSLNIMDATESEVHRLFTQYDVNYLIHGHTHRPQIHQYDVNNTQKYRFVLGDWGKDSFYLKVDEHTDLSTLQLTALNSDT